MTHGLDFRLGGSADLPQLADLRWRLKTDDAPVADPDAYDQFVRDFIALHGKEWRRDELFHWVAADANRLVAVMSIIIVHKVPSPGDLHAGWGYLTNGYALPDMRNGGVGGTLLEQVKQWARDEGLELLIVWPSDRALTFYERAGFARPADPLVLRLE